MGEIKNYLRSCLVQGSNHLPCLLVSQILQLRQFYYQLEIYMGIYIDKNHSPSSSIKYHSRGGRELGGLFFISLFSSLPPPKKNLFAFSENLIKTSSIMKKIMIIKLKNGKLSIRIKNKTHENPA